MQRDRASSVETSSTVVQLYKKIPFDEANEVVDVGLSDHRLLHWSMMTTRPAPIYRTTTVRQWRLLDNETFRSALPTLDLCHPASRTYTDIFYSPIHAHITSSSSVSPLCTSITPSLIHYRLKTYRFDESYPP